MLLSINPEHVDSILRGIKKYEFRKVRCRAKVEKIIIYATAPQKMVVAEAEIEEIIEGNIFEVWRQTKEFAGISYSFFRTYYIGRKRAVAYQLCNVKAFDEPRSLSEYGVSHPPQSFIYLHSD